ncbi:MAG: putative phospholipid-binding lipoprotein MlaA [Pseudomonadota bacterium]|jgi:ABC-type transporter lipoprotein component MlaA
MLYKIINKKIIIVTAILCISKNAVCNINVHNIPPEEDEFTIQEDQTIKIQDPLIKLNKSIFKFNVWMIDNITYPVFSNYKKYVPLPIRWSIKNFGENFAVTPFDITYSVLDLDIEAATIAFWRLLINSTIGFFGIVDIANYFDIPTYGKNFSQVMHFYGIPEGPYIMIPVLGPRTNRGAIGMLFDMFIGSPLLLQTLGIPVFIAQPYSGFLNPFYQFGAINSIQVAYEIPSNLYTVSLAEAATDVLHQIQTSGVDLYDWSKIGYLQYYRMYMSRYDERRKYKIMKTKNICDNDWNLNINDSFNDDKCQDDAKKYQLTFGQEDDE